MAPAIKSAVFFVPAILLAWFALRTSMPIYALRIVTFGLIIARGHPGNLLEDLFVVSAQLIIMVVVASRSIAGRGALQKEDVAQLELLNALDVLARNGVVHLVNTLTQAITIDSWSGRHNRGSAA